MTDSIDVLVIGSYVQDHCWQTERAPERGETCLGAFSTGPGGKGFNQAIAAHRQGVSTCFMGAIGDDALGAVARRFASDDGLRAEWFVCADAPTAASSIVLDARGDNRIVVALGANEKLGVAQVRARESLISQAKVLLMQLETDLDGVHEALSIARAQGVTTLLNPAPLHPKLDPATLRYADIITPNETEFALLIEKLGGTAAACRDARAAATLPDDALHELSRSTGVPTVVITLGCHGCFVSHADPALRRDADAAYRIAPEAVNAIDTTGAGDAFSGGLAAGLVLFAQRPFRTAVVRGNRVAALSTETIGTAPAMPDRARVEARFA
ncbi:MAG TPA: ribokinase [Candidatus Saccharimonadia bacterium]|nr:ribokinase [Candidatus Saccharimonadia bacterium]